MQNTSEKICLVIPAYNEERRLNVGAFEAFLSAGHMLCFADDGSTDGTLALLKKHFSNNSNVIIFSEGKNFGKAEIIRKATLYLTNLQQQLKPFEWVGFWDADLATPLSEVEYFLNYRKYFTPNAKAIFGSRVYRLGANIKRTTQRHYLGRAFATLAYLVLGINTYDSQCGAKLFKKSELLAVFSKPFVSKWIFDIEILLRLGEKNVVEVPVNNWHDVPGSKVKISREFFRVLQDLFAIRKQYKL